MQQRANKLTGPILCLVGPPGVGKTSLGKSIAKATGREFVRVSLGGVRDEAEIRGHRRTYIGSMPGKIIQSMRKAKTSNPLFLLDEVDKMGADFRGDPSSALLEVLDPEQNHTFNDHYLEVDYDLSNVMFITTANTLNIPPPLMDRMEIIRIAGYTEDEKVEIARKHLIPNAIAKHGLEPKEWSIDDEALLTADPPLYARSGRPQSRARAVDADPQGGEGAHDHEDSSRCRSPTRTCRDYLGVPKFRYGEVEDEDQVGVVTGLGLDRCGRRTAHHRSGHDARQGQDDRHRQPARRDEGIDLGGGVLCALARDRLRHRAAAFDKRDIHVHVPEGATPKDGPSAGVAMVTAIVSVMTGIPVHRDVAMTGEITLRGRVLPIGGLKEKLLAAHARRHQDRADPGRERQGSGRDQRQHQERARYHPGVAHGRGAGARAGAQAGADHLGGAGGEARRCSRTGGRGRLLRPHRALTAFPERRAAPLGRRRFPLRRFCELCFNRSPRTLVQARGNRIMLRTCRRVWARHMATLRRPKSRKGSRDGFRQAAVITAIGVVFAAGLFAAGDYVVQRQRGPATVKAFIHCVAAPDTLQPGGDGIYTGSKLHLPDEGSNCRQILFDNRNGRFTDNGYVDCLNAEAQSGGISSPKQWVKAARVRVLISDGFRDR